MTRSWVKQGEPIKGRIGAPEKAGYLTQALARDLLTARQQAWEHTDSPPYLREWLHARQRAEAYYPQEWEMWTRPLTKRELMIATLEGWL